MILVQVTYLVWYAATWIPAQTSGWWLVARGVVTAAALAVWPNYETGLTTIGYLCFFIDAACIWGAILYSDPRIMEESQ